LLRAKALLRDRLGAPSVLQVVGNRWTVRASAHPDPDRGRLVCIGVRGRVDRARLDALLEDASSGPPR